MLSLAILPAIEEDFFLRDLITDAESFFKSSFIKVLFKNQSPIIKRWG